MNDSRHKDNKSVYNKEMAVHFNLFSIALNLYLGERRVMQKNQNEMNQKMKLSCIQVYNHEGSYNVTGYFFMLQCIDFN